MISIEASPLRALAAEDKSILSLGPGEPDFETPKPLLNYLKIK